MAKNEATAFVAQWKRTLTLPIAHDAAGTATASYVTAHGQSSPFLPSVMPLAFVVGPDGVIRWQGAPEPQGVCGVGARHGARRAARREGGGRV